MMGPTQVAAGDRQITRKDTAVESDYRYLGFYNNIFDGGHYKIGMARSTNLSDWEIISDTIIDKGAPGAWDDVWTHLPVPVLVDGVIYVYYNGYDGSFWKIGLARSFDGGVTWEKYGSKAVLAAGGGWEGLSVSSPGVIYDKDEPDPGKRWKMWYNNGPVTSIGYAYSADGLSWTKYKGNPVIELGVPGAWDDGLLGSPSIAKRDDTYLLFYGGGHARQTAKTGLATFTDPQGIYTRSADNPLLTQDGLTVAIISDMAEGSVQVQVEDATIFPVGAPVWVYDSSNHYLTSVTKHLSATVLEFADAAPVTIKTTGGNVRSAAFGGIGAATPLYDGGWIFPLTAYHPEFGGSYSKEVTMIGRSRGDDLSKIIIDYSEGLAIPITVAESRGGNVSRENLHFLDLWQESEEPKSPYQHFLPSVQVTSP